MNPGSSEPPRLLLWLRERPVAFALASAVLMVVAGLVIFRDLRPALAGGVASAVFIYAAWRRGGFGWRIEARQQGRRDEGSDLR